MTDHVTYLHLAATTGDKDVVSRLLSAGAAAGARDGCGRTPLHRACAAGRTAACALLLQQHCTPVNAVDNDCATSLYLACLNESTDVALMLLREPGVDINLPKGKTWKPLHAACRRGLVPVIEVMLQHDPKPDVNAPVELCQMYTPLHTAIMSKNVIDPTVLRLLVEAGADVNRPTSHGMTPLHLACSRNVLALVEYLACLPQIQLGARNAHGRTPLDIACYYGFEEIAIFLGKKMCKTDIEVQEGRKVVIVPLDKVAAAREAESRPPSSSSRRLLSRSISLLNPTSALAPLRAVVQSSSSSELRSLGAGAEPKRRSLHRDRGREVEAHGGASKSHEHRKCNNKDSHESASKSHHHHHHHERQKGKEKSDAGGHDDSLTLV
eukprot:TRINITY_DN5136_c0_g1_i5.p1 TRINITY_DN5136_c0_g1~~TRINITY_DN5136_c0_g1_i5.p1  ORF type:complete len:381 (-),score=81.05 TRINITY_DN5136_c0_g1_i5:109-1251(-)